MFRIFTKEKKSKELFNINLNAAEVAELMGNNLFLDYPEINKDDCIIVEQEVAFKYPTYIDGIIREMTKQELVEEGIEVQLGPGEKIENKKIIKIVQPSRWHTWNGTEWVVNLNEVKKAKREELKTIRDNKVRENITLYGAEFQIRNNTDIENFKDVDRALDKKIKKPSDKRNWILADNTIREFTYEQLSKILDEKASRKEKLYDKFGALSIQLENSNSVEEIEAIKWE